MKFLDNQAHGPQLLPLQERCGTNSALSFTYLTTYSTQTNVHYADRRQKCKNSIQSGRSETRVSVIPEQRAPATPSWLKNISVTTPSRRFCSLLSTSGRRSRMREISGIPSHRGCYLCYPRIACVNCATLS